MIPLVKYSNIHTHVQYYIKRRERERERKKKEDEEEKKNECSPRSFSSIGAAVFFSSFVFGFFAFEKVFFSPLHLLHYAAGHRQILIQSYEQRREREKKSPT